jgi:hypothetical protein
MPTNRYEDYYRALMAAIGSRLKPFGFARKGVNFYLGRGDGNWAVVNVWRHWLNSPTRSRFTVDYGIFSYSVACCDDAVESKPPIYRCHWRRHLNEDWWEIFPETDRDALANEVSTSVVEIAVPAMLPLLTSDRKLAEAFGPLPGVEFPQVYYQAVLFKAVGDLANYRAGEKVIARAVKRAARDPGVRDYWKEKLGRLRTWQK